MVKFNFKGFSISYELYKLGDGLYAAEGEACSEKGGLISVKKFHTEQSSAQEAKKDIINRIESYIDYELDNNPFRTPSIT